MERSSIQTKDTWDLSYIYQTNQEFYTDLQKAKDLLQVIYHLTKYLSGFLCMHPYF